MDEWLELTEDFKKLEATHKTYLDKLAEATKYQKECEKQIHHQRYRLKALPPNRREDAKKRSIQLAEIEQTMPKESDTYLKLILGNVNVSILDKDDKFKYKSEYEKFKLVLSAVAFVLAVSNLWYISRGLERVYLLLLVWYYCTLTLRESILKVNGSKIKGWWRYHHFISSIAAAILLIWPESTTWAEFRTSFMVFNAYLSVVQYLQFRYQQGVLYRLKALGERHNMDITIEGFHQWMWSGLSFLFPFLFIVYFFQLYLACTLCQLRATPGATWHVTVLSILFFMLSLGNITTMLMIIPDKFKKYLSHKLRLT